MKGMWLFLIGIYVVGVAVFGSESNFETLPLGPSIVRYDLEKIEKNQMMDTRSKKIVNIADMISAAGKTDVFIIGEFHDNHDCHAFQRDFIQALYEKCPRLIIGFEFFTREDDGLLEQWRTGKISEAELIEKTGWYQKTALHYGYTRMVMEVIRKYGIKTIGLNVSRDIMHKISRSGFETLSPDEKKLFPRIRNFHPEHRYFIKTIFGVFALQVPSWFENVYQAQACWDVVMAESMGSALKKKEFKNYKAILIAGSYHVAYKLGIPFRYQRANQETRLSTIIPIAISKDDEEAEEETNPMKKMMAKNLLPVAVFSRGIGDYVFSVNQTEESFYPDLGITAKQSGDRIEVSEIQKKGIAAQFGLRKGDLIQIVDGIKIESLEQFRLLVSEKGWGDSLRLGVEKIIDFRKKNPEPH